jgi:glutamate-1-semialdehyde 2,1-aminomutase
LFLPFNDLPRATALIEAHAADLALVLMEPMLGFAGAIPAEHEFIHGIRALTQKHGILLAFDEVVTGFRIALGGGQEHYGVRPDLTVFGKAVGGGMPLAGFGGRAEIMAHLSSVQYPHDHVFQSGTYSALPVAVAAGLATLKTMIETNAIAHLQTLGDRVRTGLREIVTKLGIVADVTGLGPLFHLHFTAEKVRAPRPAEDADHARIRALHTALLSHGCYFYAGRVGFLSAAHSIADVDHMLSATRAILAS